VSSHAQTVTSLLPLPLLLFVPELLLHPDNNATAAIITAPPAKKLPYFIRRFSLIFIFLIS
jgi:hypothetical protein